MQKRYVLLSLGYLLIPKIFISISSTYLMNLTFLYFYIQKHSPNPKIITDYGETQNSTIVCHEVSH